MRILVINPNTTASMTEKIAAAARSVAGMGVEIVAVNPTIGPASIEGHYDEAISTPELLKLVKEGEADGFDGFVVACFDDPAIGACREIATGPVVGICEAAARMTSAIASSFSVVTTLPRAVPIIEENLLRYGMERRCRKVRSANLPVLALEHDRNARQQVLEAIKVAALEDQCEAVILGCAGMADLTQWLSDEAGLPVIDGVVAGVKFVEALVGAQLRTSKIGGYASPRLKDTPPLRERSCA